MTDISTGEIIIYQTEDGQAKLDVRLEKETIWLDAHQMGRLFERDRSVIVKHIRNIYKTGELPPDSTCAKNAQVAADGKIRRMDVYNLDMIISVGYKSSGIPDAHDCGKQPRRKRCDHQGSRESHQQKKLNILF